jgi:hypothetical protein
MEGLLAGIENEVRPGRSGDPPADDPPREGLDGESAADEAVPGPRRKEIVVRRARTVCGWLPRGKGVVR